MFNPFQTGSYISPQYFCNRKRETNILLRNITNRVSTTLISHRRMGKTGLIHHVIQKAGKENIILYADILETENKSEFLNALASAAAAAAEERKSFGKIIWEFLKSLRPIVSFDSLSGKPKLSVESKPSFINSNIESFLRFFDKQNKRVVLAIDEFQQITNYPEKNTDAFLRSIYQQMKNVCFIFSGSKKNLMQTLFADASRPFYRSTEILPLDKIQKSDYIPFIGKHFSKSGKSISDEVINEMIDWCDGYTYYIQLLCSRVYMNSQNKITKEVWQKEASSLLEENESIFFNYRELLAKNQWDLLKGIASEGKIKMLTSKDFISKYSLGSSANVLRSLSALLKKEMIYYDYLKGEKYYSVYDVLLMRYLQGIL